MDIQELNKQLDYLEETKNLMKQTLINKGQPVDDNTTFREYIDNMDNLIDTTDATATADDIIGGKTAYVNDSKLTGNIPTVQGQVMNSDTIQINNNDQTIYLTESTSYAQIFPIGALFKNSITIGTTFSDFNSEINLTADKIKQGETILGISGTYTGSAMKEYTSETDMNNDIANISDGEVVKVVESGTTSYFIKETISGTATMTKLVKESETMSPQEYNTANDIADEILGE